MALSKHIATPTYLSAMNKRPNSYRGGYADWGRREQRQWVRVGAAMQNLLELRPWIERALDVQDAWFKYVRDGILDADEYEEYSCTVRRVWLKALWGFCEEALRVMDEDWDWRDKFGGWLDRPGTGLKRGGRNEAVVLDCLSRLLGAV